MYKILAPDFIKNKNMYDDEWHFELQGQIPHYWGVGRSSSKENIWFDPWKEQFYTTPPTNDFTPSTTRFK